MNVADDIDVDTRALLCGIACHAGAHLTAVATELSQLDCLLHEAIAKLSGSFMALHQSCQQQQIMLAALLPDRTDAALAAEDIKQQLNSVITALQFQDMASQLIASMDKRIAGLNGILGEVAGQHCEGGATALASTVASHSDELARRMNRAVNQQHMESGDIELF